MHARDASTRFGQLLRQYRRDAGLTQEQLAERAGLSVYSISNQERGVPHLPRADTIHLLATALDLSPAESQALVDAARGVAGPAQRAVTPAGPAVSVPAAPVVRGAPVGWEGNVPVPPAGLEGKVPMPPASLIGRDALVQSIVERLRLGEDRLLTLVGPAGVGKTRLALEVGFAAQRAFADGAAFVDFASAAGPAHAALIVARGLGVRERGDLTWEQQVHKRLAAKHMLLILDTCEHLLAAAPLLGALLAGCPRLVVLATSRAPMRVRAERELVVPPLAVEEAVALFVARAQAVLPDFALTDANAATVRAICERLDGLPLAVELAAARSKLLSPEALLAMLDRPLDILAGGVRDLPVRQQSLRTTLDWSYALLDPPTQAVFRCLAVFSGAWSLSDVQPVGADAGIQYPTMVEAIATLIDHSLLVRQDGFAHDSARFIMLGIVQAYARELLELSGGREALPAHRLATAI